VKPTVQALNEDDHCRREAILGQSWERASLTPTQLLYRGIESGLTSDAKDPGQHAGDRVMGMAVSRPIETPQEDLLGLAEHTAALADMIVWLLRTEGAWQRPAPVQVGDHLWEPDCFMGPNQSLRRVVLVDRWTDDRAIAESFDWRTMEAAIYGMPMTLVVVVLGASRDGRRHGPLAKGWLHPVSQQLRFRKRDGAGFDGDWKPIFRENFKGDREEWLEQLTEDMVLGDHLVLFEASVPDRTMVVELANSKLTRLRGTAVLPDPQLSQCFDPIHRCQFSSCCPYFRMPSDDNGFIPL
jgi:hypothetical protein